MSKTPVANISTEMQILIYYILNNIRFVVLYARRKVSTRDKLEKINDVTCNEKGSKTILADNFNHYFNTQEREDFVKVLRVEDLELRFNPKHYKARGRAIVYGILKKKILKKQACVYAHIVIKRHCMGKFR